MVYPSIKDLMMQQSILGIKLNKNQNPYFPFIISYQVHTISTGKFVTETWNITLFNRNITLNSNSVSMYFWKQRNLDKPISILASLTIQNDFFKIPFPYTFFNFHKSFSFCCFYFLILEQSFDSRPKLLFSFNKSISIPHPFFYQAHIWFPIYNHF